MYPVYWYCRRVDKYFLCSGCSVPNMELGFLCSCGTWVRRNSKYHKVLRKKEFEVL